MPKYQISTPTMTRSGTVALSVLESVGFPYHFLSKGMIPQFQANVPFSLLITSYDAQKGEPFQIDILSPDFSMTTTLSSSEFETLVCNQPLYQNTAYELLYVRSGEYYQRIENTRHKYIAGSCCLMNRAVRHVAEYHTDVHTITLSLSRDFLYSVMAAGEGNYFHIEKAHHPTDLMRFLQSEYEREGSAEKKYIDFHPLFALNEQSDDILTLFDQMISLCHNPGPGATLMIRAIIYQILTLLNSRACYDTHPIQLGTPTESRLFAQITELMERTGGRISRAGLSEALNYSGNYLNRVVLKFSGMNISEYGNSFTMQKAAQLLTNSEKTISDIVLELGFSDRTHFYRLFQKEFGMTPRAYRLKLNSSIPS